TDFTLKVTDFTLKVTDFTLKVTDFTVKVTDFEPSAVSLDGLSEGIFVDVISVQGAVSVMGL
ncbi:MAG TPA: hypothetical protein PK490_06275, partial [Prosthecobacter sp.]|nr:hypothetical protein [Prosthecobacter sp.]